MDLTQSIEPRSDQVNADDLVGGPITYTIREVRQGAAEQPFDFMLAETDRAYRPSKTMRRLIVAAWGPDANQYTGRRLTLYREPTIKFGGATVGGIRISHMSHISKRIEEKFQTTRGKRESFTVNPLPPSPSDPASAPAQDPRITALRAEWNAANPERREEIEAQVAELSAVSQPDPDAPETIRENQRRKMFALFNEAGVKDRDQRLDIVRDIVGLDIASTNELTVADADKVINYLGETAGAP